MIQRSQHRPDIVVDSVSMHCFMLIELVVSHESKMEVHHNCKVAKYIGLVADISDADDRLIDTLSGGLISRSMYDALKQLGQKGTMKNKVMKSLMLLAVVQSL